MYYKKNLDFVTLIWEDLAYQIDNIDSKKQDKMFYPKFTKIIIHHFLDKDKSISIRNRMFMHTARDDSLHGTKPPKSRKSQKKSDSTISSEESPSKKKSATAKKVVATKPKPTKKKATVKADRASSLGDGTDLESGVPDVQHRKTPITDEGTGTKPGVPDVPKYDSESDKESWSDSEEEDDDDEDEIEDDEGNDVNDNDDNDEKNGDDDDNNDANDDDNQEDDDKNDDEEETDSDITDSDIIKIHVLNQSTTEYYEEEEERLIMKRRWMKKMMSKLLNLENPSLADNEIASLMDTIVCHEEPGSQTSSFNTFPITVVPAITSVFTITIPPPPPFFNPFLPQATLTLTPTTSEATTLFPLLLDFSSVFKFNDRVTNLEKDMSEIKQVGQEEDQAEKRDYIELVDISMRAILKEEVNTQLPQILPQGVSNFATPVIEKNVTESLEAAVLSRSSSQPMSTYEAATSLFEFKLTNILINKMEKNKSYDKTNYKRELYDALRSRDDKDKDEDPSAGSDRGTKKRKSSKEAESSRDSRSKEKKYSSTSKDTSHSQHKPSSKSTHAEEPSHTTWISQVACAKEPTTSFDELLNTLIDFSAFVLNRLNIKDLTQAILVGLAFDLLKGTCKSLTKLDYHLEECSKAINEGLEWHNPEGKPYLFDLRSKDIISAKEEMEWIRQTKGSGYDLGYRKVALSKEANAESGEVCLWKRIREWP
ncbi:hypothetical protein Tco_1109454 [Tanacetum coccineum]